MFIYLFIYFLFSLDRANGWLSNYKLYDNLKTEYNKQLKREHIAANIAIIQSQVCVF
jgi:hypothetical protein